MTGSSWARWSFRRIVDVPFPACVAALHSGQLTRPDGGPGLVRGPAEHDPDSGTCRVQVRLPRGPLRRPLRMRLQADHWSSCPPRTALELIPCGPVRPSAAYFRAGHLLLDTLARSLARPGPEQRPDCLPARQPITDQRTPRPDWRPTRSAAPASPAAGMTVPRRRQGRPTADPSRAAEPGGTASTHRTGASHGTIHGLP